MISLDDLLAAGGRLHGPAHQRDFTDIAYDSRLVQAGELFVALRSDRADGHDYIADALKAGARGILCARPVPVAAPATCIVADDPPVLLRHWASRRLARLSPRTIAVAGSLGKTSTRNAIATLLKTMAPTFRSRRSFNSLLGVPIALARLTPEHRFAVLEFAGDRHGGIAELASWFPPQIVVMTNIADSHPAAFGSPAAIAADLSSLPMALPAGGMAVLNGDDPLLRELHVPDAVGSLLFGSTSDCDLQGEILETTLAGTRLRLAWRGRKREAQVPLVGEPALPIALAAVATALVCGMDFDAAAAALAAVELPAGRLRPLPGGVPAGGATIIDDSAGATPLAMQAALRSLAQLPARRKIVLLGPSETTHVPDTTWQELGRLAAQVADLVIVKGRQPATLLQAMKIANAALVQPADTAAGALAALPADLGTGDLLLVSGAAAARLERVVAELVAVELRDTGAVIRQEPAWRSVRIAAPERPTWLRIDLDAIAHNVRRLIDLAGVPLMAVLKADAYGHGAVRTARAALRGGATALAVATLGEARRLRKADIVAPILVLGYTPPWQARQAIALDVACTLFDHDTAHAFATAARDLQRRAVVHVKIDTGMGRLGLDPQAATGFLAELRRWPDLDVVGLYTHFATADSADEAFARRQLSRFQQLLTELTASGLRPPLVHAANTAALLRFPAARFDMVRPGIGCYGLAPAAETALPGGFVPALSFHSEVAQVREHPAGTAISYGGRFVTERPTLVATVPAGYADGLRRAPAWRAMLLRGRRAPLIGRICMDYAMLDVTDIPGVKRGDPVVLIGPQQGAEISADEVADWLGTINYEVLTSILARVPREVDE